MKEFTGKTPTNDTKEKTKRNIKIFGVIIGIVATALTFYWFNWQLYIVLALWFISHQANKHAIK